MGKEACLLPYCSLGPVCAVQGTTETDFDVGSDPWGPDPEAMEGEGTEERLKMG